MLFGLSNLVGLTALATLATITHAEQTVYEISGGWATFYYDLTYSQCADGGGGANWAKDEGINTALPPSCESNQTSSLTSINSNNIVAIDDNFLFANMAALCGKEVQMFDGTGKQIETDGPLYVWDGCQACEGGGGFDLSTQSWIALNGGNDRCAAGKLHGVTMKVTDKQIVQPSKGCKTCSGAATAITTSFPAITGGGGGGAASTTPAASSTPPVSSSTPPAASSTPPAASSTPLADAGSKFADPIIDSSKAQTGGGSCTLGQWQCAGNAVQVCNYVDETTLSFVTTSTCPGACAMTGGTPRCT